MDQSKPVYIIDDIPLNNARTFGFDAYARTISDLIAYKENKTPLVIGIHGEWGSGKTTLMETVKHCLKEERFDDRELYRETRCVWFQAWKYGNEEEILAAMIDEIFKTMKADGFFKTRKAEIMAFMSKLDAAKGLGNLVSQLMNVDVSEIFSDKQYRKKIGFYEAFQDFFDRLLWNYLKLRPEIDSPGEPDDSKGALVVFIDDLDRCPRLRIIKVLETIKLFMDKKGCIFVIGAANEIIEKALVEVYGDDAGSFMDKIVQVTFNLPRIGVKEFLPFIDAFEFIQERSPKMKAALVAHLGLILPAMGYNPRRLKRFLNNLNLQHGLLKNCEIDLGLSHLLLWNIIDYIYPALGKDIKDNPEILTMLRKSIATLGNEMPANGHGEIPEEKLSRIPKSFHGYLRNRELVDIVRNFDVSPGKLRQLTTLSGIVESVEDAKEKREMEEKSAFDDMVAVRAGKFFYGEKMVKTVVEGPYFIDIYPVTNRRFREFIHAGGYRKERYWSKSGRKWLKSNFEKPEYWDDERFNDPEQPVVGGLLP